MFRKKTCRCIILAISLILIHTGSLYAATGGHGSVSETTNAVGYLQNQYGEVFQVDAKVTTSVSGQNENNRNLTKTIEFDTSDVKPLNTRSTQVREEWDSTYSVKFNISQTYSTKTLNGTKYYLISKVTGGYDISDLNVSIKSQSLYVTCIGAAYGSGGSADQYKTFTPAAGNDSFSYSTGFTKYVADAINAEIGTLYEVQLVRKSSPWTFHLENYL